MRTAIMIAAATATFLAGGLPASEESAPATTIVATGTPPTTTEPCSTGVINERGGCEPVGVPGTGPDQDVPPVTGPASVEATAPQADDCLQREGDPLPEGSFTIFDAFDAAGVTGTTRFSFMPCGPPPLDALPAPATTTPAEVLVGRTLPETGPADMLVVILTAIASIGFGVMAIRTSRR